jgi:hypothetical protein
MNKLEFSPLIDAAPRPDTNDPPLPYRQAVPLVFAISLVLWALLWKAGAMVLRLLTD